MTASSPLRRPADAWQAVAYADVPKGGSLVVLGLGPMGIGTRIARHRGIETVIGIDLDRNAGTRPAQRHSVHRAEQPAPATSAEIVRVSPRARRRTP